MLPSLYLYSKTVLDFQVILELLLATNNCTEIVFSILILWTLPIFLNIFTEACKYCPYCCYCRCLKKQLRLNAFFSKISLILGTHPSFTRFFSFAIVVLWPSKYQWRFYFYYQLIQITILPINQKVCVSSFWLCTG